MSTISGRESELIRAAHELVKSMDSWSVEKRSPTPGAWGWWRGRRCEGPPL
jgi:hypothetical protein